MKSLGACKSPPTPTHTHACTHTHTHTCTRTQTHLSPLKNHSSAVKLARGSAAPSEKPRPGVTLVSARAVALAGPRFMSTTERSVRDTLLGMLMVPVGG